MDDGFALQSQTGEVGGIVVRSERGGEKDETKHRQPRTGVKRESDVVDGRRAVRQRRRLCLRDFPKPGKSGGGVASKASSKR